MSLKIEIFNQKSAHFGRFLGVIFDKGLSLNIDKFAINQGGGVLNVIPTVYKLKKKNERKKKEFF